MLNIQTLEDSWKEHRADYLEGPSEDEAREEHLKDWAGVNSLAVWRHVAKDLGIDFDISEVEEALTKTGGNIEQTVEALQVEAEETDYWAQAWNEAFTTQERNPSLIGVN